MSTCRIRLKRGDRELELEGDRDFVEAQLTRFGAWFQDSEPVAESARRLEAPEPEEPLAADFPRVAASFRVTSSLSLEEFLHLKAPQTPLGRLLVLAYFLEKYQNREAYAPEELRRWWTERWPAEPLDPLLLDEAVDAGYLEWETPETLTLTFSGQLHVRDGLA